MSENVNDTQPLETVERPFIAGDKVNVKGQGAGKINQVFGNGDVLEIVMAAKPPLEGNYYITVSKSIVTHGN